jgi:hypothetical protein
MTQILEVFADTGETVERDRTPAEQAQYETDQAAAVVAEQERADAEAERVAARESAIVKLSALGLNDAEIKAIMGEDLEGATK